MVGVVEVTSLVGTGVMGDTATGKGLLVTRGSIHTGRGVLDGGGHSSGGMYGTREGWSVVEVGDIYAGKGWSVTGGGIHTRFVVLGGIRKGEAGPP